MPKRLSETVSKKRGRPEVFDRNFVKAIAGLYPDLTHRQVMAKCYETKAVGAIEEASGVEKLFNMHGKPYMATALEQLGRLAVENDWEPAELLEIARIINRRIAQESLTARQAVALLKIVRFDCKQKKP